MNDIAYEYILPCEHTDKIAWIRECYALPFLSVGFESHILQSLVLGEESLRTEKDMQK